MSSARIRLGSLWLSQAARVTADHALFVFVLLKLAESAGESESAWRLLNLLAMLPAVLLAPLNGALCNSLPRRGVLIGSSAYLFLVAAGCLLSDGPWLVCWGLAALGCAVYRPARDALLPAAAEETDVPLTTVNGWIELGSMSALVCGLALSSRLYGQSWLGAPAAAFAVAGLNLVALLTAIPVRFAGDVCRPAAPPQAVAGFFRDAAWIAGDRAAWSSLVGLAGARGLIAAILLGLVAATEGGLSLDGLVTVSMWGAAGVAVGSVLAGLQGKRRRALGLVPLGCVGLVLGLLAIAVVGVPVFWLTALLGIMCGLMVVPLAANYQANVPADARGNAMALGSMAEVLSSALMVWLMYGLVSSGGMSPSGLLWLLVAAATAAALLAWRILYRLSLEQLMELALTPLYRVTTRGPGFEQFPAGGPVLVVANHSAWFDPVWLGKVLPRDIRPMMTSLFYDLPGLRWLMRDVVRAIRVQASSYRREAPELHEAVAVLDEGECVVIFPEGSCRKKEERPLRQFGQGVWHLLHERPDTLVIVCWIEGGWGSFFSWKNGKPMKNKSMDCLRRIDIAASAPQRLAPEMIADQRRTRAYLRQLCLDTRRHLGLQPFPPDRILDESGEADEDEPSSALSS